MNKFKKGDKVRIKHLDMNDTLNVFPMHKAYSDKKILTVIEYVTGDVKCEIPGSDTYYFRESDLELVKSDNLLSKEDLSHDIKGNDNIFTAKPEYNKYIPTEKTTINPEYYKGKIEVIDFIQEYNLNFSLGNVVKYVARAGKKNESKYLEDLEKAKKYLEYEIKKAQNGPENQA